MSNEWLETNIRIGPLGAHYLNWSFIMEGDTPAFLGLVPNGLNAPEHPVWYASDPVYAGGVSGLGCIRVVGSGWRLAVL